MIAARVQHKTLLLWLAAAVCWLLLPLLGVLPAGQRLDNVWLDQLSRWRAEARAGDISIVVIDVDQASMQAMVPVAGKWPWPRSVHAELLEALLQQEPRAVVFDLFFSEADLYRPDDDAWFGEVLAGAPNAYVAALQLGGETDAPLLATYPASVGLQQTANARPDARGWLLLPRALPESAWRVGAANFTPDADGTGRRYDLYRDMHGWRWPSLPARVAADLGATLPDSATHLIDWPAGGDRPYTRLPYAEVYAHVALGQRSLPDDFFRNRIVLIGTTASGLHDLRPTPIADDYPGVFMVAAVIDNLINGDALRAAPPLLGWTLFAVLLAACAELARRRRVLLAIALGAAGAILLAALSAMLSLVFGWLLPLLSPLLLLLLFLGIATLMQYRQRQQELARTVRTFERFMDAEVVRRLIHDDNPQSLLATKSCHITVLFSDIRDFTSYSERRSAVEVVRLLDDYFGRQVAVIFRHGGTLDKFIGDAVMAFWGAPLPVEEQERAAVACALEMRREVARFRRDYGFPDFEIGVGLHSGPAVVGMVGCEQRYEYTAIGDTVNLASRIEGLTKELAPVLVSAATRAACEGFFEFRSCGVVRVKGRDEAVELFEPLDKEIA